MGIVDRLAIPILKNYDWPGTGRLVPVQSIRGTVSKYRVDISQRMTPEFVL